jgi:pyruvate ferredoxin oxidoreductase beta subunit
MATKSTPKELSTRQDRLSPGHRLCAGCGASVIVRHVLMGAKDHPVVVSAATGCLEVSTTIYPFTAWKDSYIHSAFENAAATISGVDAAVKSLKRQGRYDKDVRLVAFGGDGGTYDIGLQALSGALERGHDFVYVCYDNGAYMNTGFQRSGSTPQNAWTTTSPTGKAQQGKTQRRKNLTAIAVAHDIPYVAQASPHNYRDLVAKAERAFETPGPAFLNVLSPCPRGWRSDVNKAIEHTRMMVQSCFWPLYEVIEGRYVLNYDPKNRKIPVIDWMKLQGRFSHLFKPENEHLLVEFQEYVDREWERIKAMSALGVVAGTDTEE